MARTTRKLVEGVLGSNYGPLADGSLPDLDPFIDTASAIVDRVSTCAANKGLKLSGVELELVERWLSAHCYCQMDPLMMSKSSGGASGGFQRAGATDDFGSTDYGKTACRLDYSGCLSAIGKRQFAGGMWLGQKHS